MVAFLAQLQPFAVYGANATKDFVGLNQIWRFDPLIVSIHPWPPSLPHYMPLTSFFPYLLGLFILFVAFAPQPLSALAYPFILALLSSLMYLDDLTYKLLVHLSCDHLMLPILDLISLYDQPFVFHGLFIAGSNVEIRVISSHSQLLRSFLILVFWKIQLDDVVLIYASSKLNFHYVH